MKTERYIPRQDGGHYRVWDSVLRRFPLGVGAKKYTDELDCAEKCAALNAWD